MTPHYKMIEVGGKKLAVFYPQYKDDDGYKIIDPENRFPIELKNHDEYMSFLQTLIEREQELKDGLTTLADLIEEMDMLARGPKGDTRYMWVKYADDEQGKGMSDDPTGKKYIGFAFNKDTETPSDNPGDYKWVKYVADYEGLEIGGRNLFTSEGWTFYDPYASEIESDGTKYLKFEEKEHSDNIIAIKNDGYVPESGVFTFSGYVKIDGQIPSESYFREISNRSGSGTPEVRFDSETGYFAITQLVPDHSWAIHGRTTTPTVDGRIIELFNIKFEKGTIATDWTPAPEDIYALIDDIDAEHVGLGNVQNYGIASQSQAENGTSNSAYMTPLRTKQAIEKLSPNYVIDTEIGDDYILKKYSDGTFELKGHDKRTESLTFKTNDLYRTGNLFTELTPIMDDSFKLVYSNAWLMDGHVNTFLVMSSISNPLSDKRIRYRITGNNLSPSEDLDFIIGYEAYGTWS